MRARMMELQLDPQIQAEVAARTSPESADLYPAPEAAPAPPPSTLPTRPLDSGTAIDVLGHWAEPGQRERKKSTFGVNDAGLGLTRGDWQIGARPTLSTDGHHDRGSDERREEGRREDQDRARRAGQKTPNPIKDELDKLP